VAADDAALAAVEHRVRQRVARALAGLANQATASVVAAMRANPNATGAELVSDAGVHTALTQALATARAATSAAVAAGHAASAKLGTASARAALREVGHTVPGGLGADEGLLANIEADLTRAFAGALLDLQRVITDAVDGVRGTSGAVGARTMTVHAAIRRAARRLAVRTSGAASMSVQHGFEDTKAAAWTGYAGVNPYVRAVKTWQVRGDNPCPACLALDGTTIAIDAQFDRSAGAPARVTAVYRHLFTPPRHPNCRCRLAYSLASPDQLASFR
jgi:hypothetical protein